MAYAGNWSAVMSHLTKHRTRKAKMSATKAVQIAKSCKSRSELSKKCPAAYRVIKEKKNREIHACSHFERPKFSPDTVYIWKALGADDLYKIGVTSSRLGAQRIMQVERASGYQAEVIAKQVVRCDPLIVEARLLELGRIAQLQKFDGCTEFRRLTDAELNYAVSIINGHTVDAVTN